VSYTGKEFFDKEKAEYQLRQIPQIYKALKKTTFMPSVGEIW
jgi:hypothetical protein